LNIKTKKLTEKQLFLIGFLSLETDDAGSHLWLIVGFYFWAVLLFSVAFTDNFCTTINQTTGKRQQATGNRQQFCNFMHPTINTTTLVIISV
jgi:hypothetical protein